MHSRVMSTRHLRLYSTSKEALKLWIKQTEAQPIKVPIKGCTDIDDFVKKVKQELNTTSQVAVFTSLEKEALRPGLLIKDLLKTDEFKNNTDEYPLLVKIISKTIYIRNMDEKCRPLDSFTEVEVQSDADIKEIYENKGSYLFPINEPTKRVTKFQQLKDGEKYGVFSLYGQSFAEEVRWQQMENMAMEAEVGRAMKDFLHSNLGSKVVDMPTDVVDANGKILQQWDAAFKVGDDLYLCEAKHVMSTDKLPKIQEKLQKFQRELQKHAQEELSNGIKRVFGVVCGTYFPPLVCQKAHEMGFICVYPSGWRYLVDTKGPVDFKIER